MQQSKQNTSNWIWKWTHQIGPITLYPKSRDLRLHPLKRGDHFCWVYLLHAYLRTLRLQTVQSLKDLLAWSSTWLHHRGGCLPDFTPIFALVYRLIICFSPSHQQIWNPQFRMSALREICSSKYFPCMLQAPPCSLHTANAYMRTEKQKA